jgi:hypothetical protein
MIRFLVHKVMLGNMEAMRRDGMDMWWEAHLLVILKMMEKN